MNEVNKKKEISPEIIVQDLKRWLYLIILTAVSVSLLYYSYRLARDEEVFEVSSTFVISSNSSLDSLSNLSKAQEVSSVFSQILNRPEIKKIILQDIGGSSLNGTLESSLIEETNLIKISVKSTDLRRAYLILESILTNQKLLLDYISDDVDMELLVSPEIAKRDFGLIKIMEFTIIVFLIILAGLIALVCFLSYLKSTIKSPSNIEDDLGVKCLAVIPQERGFKKLFKNKNLLVSRPSISFQYVESINRLCRKIRNRMHGEDKELKTLMITSVRENEGKSSIAANIAYSLYLAGKEVLIIDLDLMNPSIYKIFSVTEELTAFKFFLQGEPVENLVRVLEDDGLSAILNTERVKETVDLITSNRLKELINRLKNSFEYIIIDSPPMKDIVDSELLLDLVDATLLVVKQNYVKTEVISDVVNLLKDSKPELLGCVLNNAVVYSETGGYDYHTKYKYGYYSYYKDDYYKRDE